MAWAKCPTHGPIQDAAEVFYGEELSGSYCKCGLKCDFFEPETFVSHKELKELEPKRRQPREDHKPAKKTTRKKGKK